MAPSFLIDNEYILRGYRINFNTNRKICRSLFLLHNETVNVWSHIIGVIAFIALFIWSLAGLYASNTYRQLMDGDQRYLTHGIFNKEQIFLLNHSLAGEINNFDELCQKYLNFSVENSNTTVDGDYKALS